MISIKLAKEISLLKWEGELDNVCNNNKIKDLYPDAYNHYHCGFCIRHNYRIFPDDKDKCLNCEIALSPAKNCLESDSLYSRLEKSSYCGEYSSVLVKEMIEIIKNIPEDDE